MITWSKFIPLAGYVLFHRSHKFWFTSSIFFWNLGMKSDIVNWDSYYKMRQKTVIKNLSLRTYYKVRQKFITKCVMYYKVWQAAFRLFVFPGPRPLAWSWPQALAPVCIYRPWPPICVNLPWPPVCIYSP